MNPDTVQSQQDDMSDVEENDGEAAAVKERGRMEEEKEYEDGENEDEQNEAQTEDVEGQKTMYTICSIVVDLIIKRGRYGIPLFDLILPQCCTCFKSGLRWFFLCSKV